MTPNESTPTAERTSEWLELPDRPGAWYRDSKPWLVSISDSHAEGELYATGLRDNGYPIVMKVGATEFPRGGWRKAVPSQPAERAEGELPMVRGRVARLVPCHDGFAIVENALNSKAYLRADGFWVAFQGEYDEWPTREAAIAFIRQHADHRQLAMEPSRRSSSAPELDSNAPAGGLKQELTTDEKSAMRRQEECNYTHAPGIVCNKCGWFVPAAAQAEARDFGSPTSEELSEFKTLSIYQMDTECWRRGKQIAQLRSELSKSQKHLTQLIADTCEDDTAIRKLASEIIGNERTYGDTDGVPGIVEVVEMMVAQLREMMVAQLRSELSEARAELNRLRGEK